MEPLTGEEIARELEVAATWVHGDRRAKLKALAVRVREEAVPRASAEVPAGPDYPQPELIGYHPGNDALPPE
jgi:hypothetical protein